MTTSQRLPSDAQAASPSTPHFSSVRRAPLMPRCMLSTATTGRSLTLLQVSFGELAIAPPMEPDLLRAARREAAGVPLTPRMTRDCAPALAEMGPAVVSELLTPASPYPSITLNPHPLRCVHSLPPIPDPCPPCPPPQHAVINHPRT